MKSYILPLLAAATLTVPAAAAAQPALQVQPLLLGRGHRALGPSRAVRLPPAAPIVRQARSSSGGISNGGQGQPSRSRAPLASSSPSAPLCALDVPARVGIR